MILPAYPWDVAAGTPRITRRAFVIGALAVPVATGCTPPTPSSPQTPLQNPTSPTASPTPARGASPAHPRVSAPVRVAVLGGGGQGVALAKRLASYSKSRVVAVCDPDEVRRASLARLVESIGEHRPASVPDLRRVLDDPEVDAVVIATPHHWHVLAAVWALEAGKHVYLEKPATHSMPEGAALLDAWQRSGLVVEVGTQRRSHPGVQEAIASLHAGEIGEVSLARCMSWKRRPPIGPRERGSWPAALDADLWFGPRPIRRPTRRRFHYDWHWFNDYGNGGLGNNGVHRLDVARWGMALPSRGTKVLAYGGRLGPPDAGQTPNTALTVVTFGDRAVAHDLRGLPTTPPPEMDATDEVVFEGDGASLVVSRTGGRLVDDAGRVVAEYGLEAAQVDPIRQHLRSFVGAVLSGDPAAVAVGPVEGVAAAAMCHGPASALAAATSSGTRPDADAVLAAVGELCGPAMDRAAERFVRHAAAQSGTLSWSGVLEVEGDHLRGIEPEEQAARPGFGLSS